MREGGTGECPNENIVAVQCIPDMREGGTDECPNENIVHSCIVYT